MELRCKMAVLRLFVLLPALFTVTSCLEVEYKAKYYDNVTLVCDEKTVRPPYNAFLKYWILPNSTILQWSHQPNGKHRMSTRPVYSLTITALDDDDYGWYHCIILWDNRIFLVDTIKVELKPDYDDVWDRYRKGLMYGGIAAAAACAIIIVACLFGYSYYREPAASKRRDEERRAMYELDRTVQKFDEAVAIDGEVALPISMISSTSTAPSCEYATPAKIQRTETSMETVSSRSSGFFDNKALETESEAMAIESAAIPADLEAVTPFDGSSEGRGPDVSPDDSDRFSDQLIHMLTQRSVDNYADQLL